MLTYFQYFQKLSCLEIYNFFLNCIYLRNEKYFHLSKCFWKIAIFPSLISICASERQRQGWPVCLPDRVLNLFVLCSWLLLALLLFSLLLLLLSAATWVTIKTTAQIAKLAKEQPLTGNKNENNYGKCKFYLAKLCLILFAWLSACLPNMCTFK